MVVRFDTVAGSALADIPMGEFWTGGDGRISGTIVAAGRAAGRHVIAAEAFTGRPEVSKWTETPAHLETLRRRCVWLRASTAWCCTTGCINRSTIATSPAWAWVGGARISAVTRPGLNPARNSTAISAASRPYCSAAKRPCIMSASAPRGAATLIPRAVFLSGLKVEDGTIVLPSGRRYAFINVPHKGALLPEMVREIKRLLDAGATVVSPASGPFPESGEFPRRRRRDEGARLRNLG